MLALWLPWIRIMAAWGGGGGGSLPFPLCVLDLMIELRAGGGHTHATCFTLSFCPTNGVQ
jgi:cytochrome c biogenesis factor